MEIYNQEHLNAQRNDAQAFLNEVETPRIPAVEPTATPNLGNIPRPGPNPAPPPPPEYVAPEGAEKLMDENEFADEDEDQEEEEGEGGQPGAKQGYSKNFKESTILSVVNSLDGLVSTGFALWAHSHDRKKYRMDEELRDDLILSAEPYHDQILEAIPKWGPLGLCLVRAIGAKGMMAWDDRKTNLANEKAANDPATMHRAAQAVNTDEERGNFTLYSDGYYLRDRKGKQVKRPSENHLREAPNVADIEKILLIKANRSKAILFKAFGWKEADFTKHGILD